MKRIRVIKVRQGTTQHYEIERKRLWVFWLPLLSYSREAGGLVPIRFKTLGDVQEFILNLKPKREIVNLEI